MYRPPSTPVSPNAGTCPASGAAMAGRPPQRVIRVGARPSAGRGGTYAPARPAPAGRSSGRRMTMTADPGICASDEDRGRIAAALGEHYAAGRLALEEFQQRLDKTYAATTLGELDDLMTDLPGRDLGQLPGPWLPSPSGNLPLPRQRLPGPAPRPVDAPPRHGRQPGGSGSRSASASSWCGCSAGQSARRGSCG